MTSQRTHILPQIVSVLIFFLLSPFFAAHVQAAVVINEIYPKTTDVAWEFVELYNTGSTSVSLDRWKLDHTAGDGKSFILNAGAIIQPHDFIVFFESQSAITFSIEGDTVRLFDANGTLVDSQSYPSTLGYNTSVGRSPDAGDGWVICAPIPPYAATPNKSNNCPPAPTPTATPFPTSTPTPQPQADRPLAETPTPTPTQQTFGSLLPTPQPQADRPLAETGTQVLGVTGIISPTPQPKADRPLADTLQFKISKSWIAYILLGIAAAALSLMLVLWLKRRRSLPNRK